MVLSKIFVALEEELTISMALKELALVLSIHYCFNVRMCLTMKYNAMCTY